MFLAFYAFGVWSNTPCHTSRFLQILWAKVVKTKKPIGEHHLDWFSNAVDFGVHVNSMEKCAELVIPDVLFCTVRILVVHVVPCCKGRRLCARVWVDATQISNMLHLRNLVQGLLQLQAQEASNNSIPPCRYHFACHECCHPIILYVQVLC